VESRDFSSPSIVGYAIRHFFISNLQENSTPDIKTSIISGDQKKTKESYPFRER
jgi:hypothetical protein